jgi:predicted RNA-binding Zn-ribbon protein involved in translation (DUF1610 family)
VSPKPRTAAVIVLCAGAVALSLLVTRPRRAKITPETGYGSRLCDACGHRFQGVPDPVVLPCPQCGQKAGVRVYDFACQACGERFEGYRERPADPDRPYDPDSGPPVLVTKRPGGSWVPSINDLGPLRCPQCKATDLRVLWPQ